MTRPVGHPSTRVLRATVTVAFVALCMILAGCRERAFHKAEYFVFGTLVDVSVDGVDDVRAGRAFAELQSAFARMHRDWHPWEPGKLTDINRAFARGEAATADGDLLVLIRAAQEYERLTGGRFNAAIGGLIDLWGFHTSDFPITSPPPSSADIAAWVARHPTTLDIEIDGDRVIDRGGAAWLDFSGLAKGLAVDRACALLRQLGIDNALVSAGGDLRGYGSRDGRAWKIGVRNPLGGVIGSIELEGDESVFTSGNYERFRVDGTERHAHIIDPATGWPAGELMSATVIARDAMRADAAATALVVAGLAHWAEVAGPMGIDAVLLTDESGRVFGTAEMLRRIRLEAGIEADVLEN